MRLSSMPLLLISTFLFSANALSVHSKTSQSTSSLITNFPSSTPPSSKTEAPIIQKEQSLTSDEEAELLVDRTDPCDSHSNCGRCSEDSRCGWCAANSQCMIGGPSGPKLSVCAAWTKGFCEVGKCNEYSHCMSCLADPYCGWCSAPSDDPTQEIPGKCMEGGSSGPGDAEGECPDQWRHSPMRKGTGYAMASHLASVHGPYLREVCEASDGKIPYAPPPPAQPKQKAKDPVLLTMSPRNGPVFGGTHITITGMWFGYTKTDQTVTVGGRPCEETIWKSQSVIVCVTSRSQREAPGKHEVVVTYDERSSKTDQSPEQKNMATFEYREIEVDSIHPKVGKTEGGTIVSIRGKNFGRRDAFDTQISFGGVPCVVIQWESSELIKCATPPGYGTNHVLDLEIEGIAPVTGPLYFDYSVPTITGLVPRHSPTAGNLTMVVSGTNFGTREAMAVITVGKIPCASQEWISHSRIDCVTPPGVGIGHVVRVVVDVRQSENEEWRMDYLASVVANVSPEHGETVGGYAILITGDDFGTGAYEPSLRFEAAEWQYDVLDYGTPTVAKRLARAKGMKTEESNVTNATISNNTNTSTLISNALPEEVIEDENVRGLIQSAALNAATGNGVNATRGIANATLQAVLALNDTSGVGNAVAAVAAAAVETMAGIEKAKEQGEEPAEAAEQVMKKLTKQVEGNGIQQPQQPQQAPMFLEIEPSEEDKENCRLQCKSIKDEQKRKNCKQKCLIESAPMPIPIKEDVTNMTVNKLNITNSTATAEALDALNQARAAKIQADIDAQKKLNPCEENEAVDYTPRGPKCLRVLIDGRSCLEVSIVSSKILRCLVPEGIGKNLSVAVIVGNQTSMSVTGEERLNRLAKPSTAELPVMLPTEQFKYDPPIVTFMYPDVGPTAGGFVMTLKGRQFGTRDWGNGTVQVNIAGQPCTKSQWLSDNVIECIVPKGVGARHPVQVIVGGQIYPPEGSSEMLLFSYNAPIVLDVEPKNGPTDGDFDIVITGRNFGRMSHNPQPYIGGVPCTKTTWISDSVIKCVAPEGHGKDKNVVVWVGEQHSDVENNYFKYDQPIVESIEPDHCRTIGKCVVKIKGHNFGHEQGTHINVNIDGNLCANIGRGDQPQWMSHHEMECVVGVGVGQFLDVSVDVSDQVSLPNELFHYNEAAVFAIRPNHGEVTGGEEITLFGENFGTSEAMSSKILRIQEDEVNAKANGIETKYTSLLNSAKGITPSDLVKVSLGAFECSSKAWISDSEVKCTTIEGSGGDLIPTVEIGGQSNLQEQIFDERKMENMLIESTTVMSESKKRGEEGDLTMSLVFKSKSKDLKKSADAMLFQARGRMWLYDPPEIHGLSINHGPTMGKTRVEIEGINFTPDCRVVFGDTKSTNRARAPTDGNIEWDITPCKQTLFMSKTKLICVTNVGIGPSHEIFVETGGRRYAQRNVTAIRNIPKCSSPPFIKHGVIKASFEYLNSVVTYVCNENHTMIGESTLMCEAPGVWRPAKAPLCSPPPKPIPSIMYPDNSTNASQTEEPIEPEEVEVVTEMTRLSNEKDKTARAVEIIKDKETEVREVAEEHYKADQQAVATQKEATKRAMALDQAAKDAVQAKIDGEALKEAEETQKRKDADDAVAKKMEESRKAEEEKLRAAQEAAQLKRSGGVAGESAAPGSPGSGMLASEPSKEMEQKAVADAEKEENVEKIMADVAGLAQSTKTTEQAKVEAKKAVEESTKALDAIEAEVSATADPAAKAALTARRDVAVTAAEEAKRASTQADLASVTAKESLEKAVNDPKIKEARISESQLKADDANQAAMATETASKMAQEQLEVVQKTLSEAKAAGKDTTLLIKELAKAEITSKQTKSDLQRVNNEKMVANENLATMKDQVETGDVNELVTSVTKDSSVSETSGVGEAMKDNTRQRLIKQIESSTKLTEDAKEAAKGAIDNAQDVAQSSQIMNAASEGADAIREAAATATKPQTVYTMSDLIGRYLMERPDYPGRKDWELFSVRVVGGEGLMSDASAHEACRSFDDSQLVTRDIAHAARLAGFQRCQPGWIERFGVDVPDAEDDKCRSPPNENGKCPEGTEEVSKGNTLECLRECPFASAVVLAGDAGCPTNRQPPCDTTSERESDGICMTVPGTVAESTVVMAQALCTRPTTTIKQGRRRRRLLSTKEQNKENDIFLEIEHSVSETAQIPAILVYNITTGKETNRYYDLSSEKGRSLDPQTTYIASGAMMVVPAYDYDPPEIRSISPAHGPAHGGSTITMTGLNFGPNDAYFGEKLNLQLSEIDGADGKNWVDCHTTIWVSDTTAKCVTPTGVGTKRQARGQLSTLTGKGGSGLTYDRPILMKLEPNHGPPRGGYQVVVIGSNFGTVRSTWVQGTSIIKIDGHDCLATSWISDEKIRCTVPPGWSKKRFVDMEGVAEQKADSKPLFHYDRPTVTSVTPNTAPTEFNQGSITLMIDGDNFGECGGEKDTKEEYCPKPKGFINGFECLETIYVSHEQIKCVLPQGVGTDLRVTVVLGNLDSIENKLFTYSKPTIESTEPKHGPAIGGTIVTVIGEHFGQYQKSGDCTSLAKNSCKTGKCCISSPLPLIKINDINCEKTEWISNTELKCTVNKKPGVGARLPITVLIGQQVTKTLNDAVRYTINPPTITSTVPQIIPRGGGQMALVNKGREGKVWDNVPASVTLTGLNFGTSKTAIQAGFDEMICSKVEWISNTKVKCTLTTPARDGFEDRSPWVVVGGQESYAPYPRQESDVEYRVIGYKRYNKFAIGSDHLFVAEGMTLTQCLEKCTEDKACKGITRPLIKGDTAGAKCYGWSVKSLKSCTPDTDTVVHIHETVATTEIGLCHTMDTIRFGPFVASIDRSTHADPNGGEIVTVTGSNFGLPGTPKAKSTVGFVDDFPCLFTKVLSDSKYECTLPPNEASGLNQIIMKETFDTYNDGRSVVSEKSNINPMYIDVESSTGSTSDRCKSAIMPGGSWILPTTGVRMLELKPLSMRFGGMLKFAVKIGQSSNCNTAALMTTIAGTGLEIQYTTDVIGQGSATWRPLRRWSLDGSTPKLNNNEWHRLNCEIPVETTIAIRFIHGQSSPNTAISIALDDIVISSNGGPVSVAVLVDGTRSAAAPTGKDSKGQPAPNSVTVSYDNDNMISTGLIVSNIQTDDAKIGGFNGISQRHYKCTRNFQSKGEISLSQCQSECVDQGDTCTMFSWGSEGPNAAIDCRINTGGNDCSPEKTKTNDNPIGDSITNVPTLYTISSAKEARAHGAISTRVSSHVLQPATGGIFLKSKLEIEKGMKGQDSSDIILNKGQKLKILLSSPTLMEKVIVRQPSPTSTMTPKECLAKQVTFTFPDGTSTKVVFENEPEETYLTKERGDTGGEYKSEIVKPISSMFGLPVVESYQVEVVSTQGECPTGKATTLRGLEVRGKLLSNVALKGNGFQTCTTTTALGTYNAIDPSSSLKYGCQNAFDGGSQGEETEGHAWVTDGLGAGAFITTEFDTKQIISAVALRQNSRHRAKKIKITFPNLNNGMKPIVKMLENSDANMQMIALPVNENGDVISTNKVVLEIVSTYDKYAIPVTKGYNGWRLKDDFKTKEFDTKQWSFPSAALRGVDSIRYGYDPQKSGTTPLYFEGHSVGKQPVRSMLRFPTSHTEITVDLERTNECTNQFIVLSTESKYKFSHGPEANTIKFVYNCNDKYIYGPKETSMKNPIENLEHVKQADCKYAPGIGKETWNLEITEKKITFGGDRCGNPLVLNIDSNDFGKNSDGQFYIYIGASQDVPNQRSYFGKIEVKAWGTGLRDLAWLGRAE